MSRPRNRNTAPRRPETPEPEAHGILDEDIAAEKGIDKPTDEATAELADANLLALNDDDSDSEDDDVEATEVHGIDYQNPAPTGRDPYAALKQRHK